MRDTRKARRGPHAGAAAAVTAAVAAGVMALGACSDTSSPARTTTVTATATSQSGTPTGTESGSPATGSPTPSSTMSAGPLPAYPGATVVSHSSGFTLLQSGDPVSKVGSFYVDALNEGGWTTTSKYQGDYSVNLIARRGDRGVTVQVSPTGSGSSVSITSYHV